MSRTSMSFLVTFAGLWAAVAWIAYLTGHYPWERAVVGILAMIAAMLMMTSVVIINELG